MSDSYPISPQSIEQALKVMLGIALADRPNQAAFDTRRKMVERAIESMRTFASLRPEDPAEYCRGQADRWQMMLEEAIALMESRK